MVLQAHLVVIFGSSAGQTSELLRDAAASLGTERIVIVSSSESAIREMTGEHVIVFFDMDVARIEGLRVERVLRAANPNAVLVAVGPTIQASIAFRLAAHGVAAYLEKPFSPTEVTECLEALCAPLDPLVLAARSAVGVRDLKQAQRLVRLSMCEEALQRARGSRRAAARMLGVDRRAVQKIVAELMDGSTDDYAYDRALPSYGEVAEAPGSPLRLVAGSGGPRIARCDGKLAASVPATEPIRELRSRPG